MHNDDSIRKAVKQAHHIEVIGKEGGIVTTFAAERVTGWMDEIERLKGAVEGMHEQLCIEPEGCGYMDWIQDNAIQTSA